MSRNALQNKNFLSALYRVTPNLYFELTLNSAVIRRRSVGMGKHPTLPQHVAQTMTEVERILLKKLNCFPDLEIFRCDELPVSSFAKNLEHLLVINWCKVPVRHCIFLEFGRLLSKMVLQRAKQNQRMTLYTDLCIDQHPNYIGWVQGSSRSTVLRMFWSFSRCWASSFFNGLIAELVGFWHRREHIFLGASMQRRKIPKTHWGSSG